MDKFVIRVEELLLGTVCRRDPRANGHRVEEIKGHACKPIEMART
jgi:hypothetical protein